MGVQIPCGIHSQVSAEGAVREAETALGGGFPPAGPSTGEPDFGGASDAGPCPYADCDSAEIPGFAGDWVLEGQKCDLSGRGLW